MTGHLHEWLQNGTCFVCGEEIVCSGCCRLPCECKLAAAMMKEMKEAKTKAEASGRPIGDFLSLR